MFIKYPHLERYGTDEVEDITIGKCHIFPKLDGTNASIWLQNDELHCGSRNRELSLDHDNAGFMNWAVQQPNLIALLEDLPEGAVVYGEWLVPHSLKTYRDNAWRRFWVFDVLIDNAFQHYDTYSVFCKLHNVDFIPCLLAATNPTYEVLHEHALRNKFQIQENQGHGEGIVIKRYGYANRFGRTTWAKLITNAFKDQHIKEMGGATHATKLVEEAIANEFITPHTVEKIIAKIRLENESFTARHIPQLLGEAYHELITEELWEALKKHKRPKIDFKTLNTCTINRVKQLKPEIFGL